MKKAAAYLILIRPVNFAITFITVIVAAAISYISVYPVGKVMLAALTASLTLSAGNIINDIFDIEIDLVSHPERPLITGVISVKDAYILYITIQVISLLLSFFISEANFLINILAAWVLFFYSWEIKKIVLLKNIIVSGLTGLVFIYGGAAAGSYKYAIVPALFAFLINMTREIVKDMEDVEGDTHYGIISFPIKAGVVKTKNTVLGLIIFLIVFTFYPYIIGNYNKYYILVIIVLVIPVLIYFLYSFRKDVSKKNLIKLSILLKLDMVLGLIAIYLGR
jgi:geranylgeranylglycerol-phosphate geranylgeranyltransferase